jgi:hypothetical protein
MDRRNGRVTFAEASRHLERLERRYRRVCAMLDSMGDEDTDDEVDRKKRARIFCTLKGLHRRMRAMRSGIPSSLSRQMAVWP